MMKRSTLTLVLLSLSIAACADVGGEGAGGDTNGSVDGNGDGNGNGNGDGDGNGDGTGGATAAEVADLVSSVECEQAHECKANFPTDFGGTFAEVFGNSVNECYSINAEYWGVDGVEAAVAGGTIELDQAAADECLAGQVAAPVCSMFFEQGPGVPDACWAALTGTVATGGACQINLECANGGYCNQGSCAAD